MATLDNETFSIEVMVCGYYVYEDIWDAALEEQLPCQREPMNSKDPFVVMVVKSQATVGHILRKILLICSMFLRHGGTICCQVTVSRCYSKGLPEGGLEIPCMLMFQGGREGHSEGHRAFLASRSCYQG